MASGGIPKSTIQFFDELASNNDKVWWAANKDRYATEVREPFESLLAALGSEYQPWRIYRPHNDTRFAKGKASYKDFIGAVSQLPSGNGCFIQISAKGLLLGTGYPMMAPDQLTAFRAALDDMSCGPKFARLVEAARLSDITVTGGRFETLKRNPKGFAADHPQSEWLRCKGVEIPQRINSPSWLHGKTAAKQIAKLLTNGRDITKWLEVNVGPSALTAEEIWAPKRKG
jgi:uncharacterized protein (TIGR02453 family)